MIISSPVRTRSSVRVGIPWYVTSVALALGCSIPLVSSLMPLIVKEQEIGEFVAGIVQSIFFVGHISGILLAGVLGWKTKSLCWLASAATALGVFVCAGGNVPCLLLGRLLAGFGLSLSVIQVSSILVHRDPQRAGRWLCVFHAGIAASAAVTLFLAPVLAEFVGSWQVVVLGSALLCAWAAPVVQLIELPDLTSKTKRATVENPVSERVTVFTLALIVCAYVSTEQIVTGFMPLILSVQASSMVSGLITALFWTGVIGGRMAGLVPQRFVGEQTVLVIGCMLMTGALVLVSFVTSMWAVGLAAFLAGFGGGPLVPLGFGLASRTSSNSANAIFTCQTACFVGGFFGPSIAGVVADRAGLSPHLLSYFGLAPAAVCLVFVLWQFAQRTTASTLVKLPGLTAK